MVLRSPETKTPEVLFCQKTREKDRSRNVGISAKSTCRRSGLAEP